MTTRHTGRSCISRSFRQRSFSARCTASRSTSCSRSAPSSPRCAAVGLGRGSRGRARDPHAADRGDAPTRARAARVAGALPHRRARRARSSRCRSQRRGRSGCGKCSGIRSSSSGAERTEWHRHLSAAGPFGRRWKGLVAGWNGIVQFVAGGNRFPERDDPMQAAGINLEALAAAICSSCSASSPGAVSVPPTASSRSRASRCPLSSPARTYPLLSMPRFALGVFPVFVALPARLRERCVARKLWSVDRWFDGPARTRPRTLGVEWQGSSREAARAARASSSRAACAALSTRARPTACRVLELPVRVRDVVAGDAQNRRLQVEQRLLGDQGRELGAEPTVRGASCTIATRPVFATEARIASSSSGLKRADVDDLAGARLRASAACSQTAPSRRRRQRHLSPARRARLAERDDVSPSGTSPRAVR